MLVFFYLSFRIRSFMVIFFFVIFHSPSFSINWLFAGCSSNIICIGNVCLASSVFFAFRFLQFVYCSTWALFSFCEQHTQRRASEHRSRKNESCCILTTKLINWRYRLKLFLRPQYSMAFQPFAPFRIYLFNVCT